ncbi:N(6)-adenine-specific methyltransferase METTL4-like [Mytilus trossulus]|uniref:N(6)-adenine-specific methyltransferase METTL4-like n=1 Tax=Mytilus trossulus TaxID=6551 RepID=UPI0030065B12
MYQNVYGWILDHWKLTADSFKDVDSGDSTVTNFSYKKDMFEINSQFIMDSQFESKIRVQERDEDTFVNRKKRKRKRKSDLNEGEIKAKTYHDKIIEVIVRAYKSLLDGSKDMKLFRDLGKSLDNNVAARKIAANSGPGDKLRELCYTDINDLDIETVTLKSHGVYDDLCNKLVKNCSNSPIKVKIKDDFYLLPAECSFIMGDTVNLKYFSTILGRNEFDFILLDPPWENKSVKRKKQYWTLNNEELFKIPVPELSAPGCVIGVWVTNKMKHKDFVIQELFPFWNVDFITTWYWIKVTKTGSTVLDIMSEHKKPYEILILGKCKHTEMKDVSDEKIDSNTEEEHTKNDICKNMKCKENLSEKISSKSLDGICNERTILPASFNNHDIPLDGTMMSVAGEDRSILPAPLNNYNPPLEMTMMSVPSSIHSMKIPLQDIMKPYLPETPNCLEIFARNLTPGWCCYGNEVFKHQHMDYFEVFTKDSRIPLDSDVK